jgi:ubiquinone/menaquinone biosynthesis C-methylase UbiE
VTIIGNSRPTRATQETKDEIHEVYNRIAQEYDERIPGSGPADEIFGENELAFLLDRIAPGERVLDMGCGTGRFTVPIARSGAVTTGFDLSEGMLGRLQEKLDEAGLTADLRQGDMAALPFEDNSFDVVTSMMALMHIPLADRQQVWREVRRVLKPGGRMLLGVKNGVFEKLFKGDRFAAIDITDVEAKRLLFTETRSGTEFEADWYSFTPEDLTSLFARVGMIVTKQQGNIPLAVWLADEVLVSPTIRGLVQSLESTLADAAPFNHIAYHLLVEAVKPEI